MEKTGIKSQIGSRLSPVFLGTLLFVIIVISSTIHQDRISLQNHNPRGQLTDPVKEGIVYFWAKYIHFEEQQPLGIFQPA